MKYRILVIAVGLVAVAGCKNREPQPTAGGPAAAAEQPHPAAQKSKSPVPPGPPDRMKFALSSEAFKNGGTIPTKYTCDGQGISPPLKWSSPPNGSKSFAIVVEDPDAPKGTFHHWGIWAIPANERVLTANVPNKAKVSVTTPRTQENRVTAFQAKNDFGKIGYGAPCPPPGSKPHHYVFHIYALDNPGTTFTEMPTIPELAKEVKADAIAEATLVGTYQRQKK